MTSKGALKLIYICGMGVLGKNFGSLLAPVSRDPIARKLCVTAGAVTGAYIGYAIADDLEAAIMEAIDIVEKRHEDEPQMEVNHG